MKWWRIIWAMYVLVLSGVPCETFCLDEPLSAQQTSNPAADDHNQNTACSPFCLCTTCVGGPWPLAPQLIGDETLSESLPRSVLPDYQEPYTLNVPGRIWHPPRLSSRLVKA